MQVSAKKCFWYQWGLGYFLTFTDFLLTKKYLSIVGVHGEANPIQHWIIQNFGTNGMLSFKTIVFLALGILSIFFNAKEYETGSKLLSYVNILMGVVIGWSLYLLIPLL